MKYQAGAAPKRRLADDGKRREVSLDTNEVERYICMAEPGFSLRGVVRGEWGEIPRGGDLADFSGGSKSMCFTMFFCIFSKIRISISRCS